MTDVAPPFVVAVSGTSGAGKTSVVKRAVELLRDATRLHFDDYAAVSTYPANLKEWLEQGADLGEWRTPQLVSDLRRLCVGEPVYLPEERGIVHPAPHILIEEPFGRLRPEIANLIDLAVHIDVPADVLLARRLLRRLEEEGDQHEQLLARLHDDLTQYLRAGRELYDRGSLAVREAADLLLDGTRTVDEIARSLVTEIDRCQRAR